jgi:Tol biopolymer transport system component
MNLQGNVNKIKINVVKRDTLKTGIVFLLLLMNGCSKYEYEKEIYLAGEPLPGIEIFFPLGFYDAEPLMPKISPDGKKLLFTGPASLPEWRGLWIMDMEKQEKTLVHPDGRLADWAPDSDWIAFNIGTQIYKVRKDGSELTQLTFEGRNFLPNWSPDGKRLAITSSLSGLTLILTDEGEIMQTISGAAGGVTGWKPDGTAIIGFKGYSSTSVWTKFPVYDLTLNTVTKVLDASPDEDNRYPKYSPIGLRIVFWNPRGIWVMNANGEGLKRIIPSHLYGSRRSDAPEIYSAYSSWHPDGEHIIYEHFEITRSKQFDESTTHVEGVIRFYKVNAHDALSASNLSL